MSEPLPLHRLGITLSHDSLSSIQSCQAWRFWSSSAKIEATQRSGVKTLCTMTLTLYGYHRVVDVKRVTGVAMDECEHQILTWISARPFLHGWWAELRCLQEAAA